MEIVVYKGIGVFVLFFSLKFTSVVNIVRKRHGDCCFQYCKQAVAFHYSIFAQYISQMCKPKKKAVADTLRKECRPPPFYFNTQGYHTHRSGFCLPNTAAVGSYPQSFPPRYRQCRFHIFLQCPHDPFLHHPPSRRR